MWLKIHVIKPKMKNLIGNEMMTLTTKTILAVVATTALITAPITTAFAADENAPFDGAYFGGAATLNNSNTGATVIPSATLTLDSKQKAGAGLYAGFGKQVEQFYVGLEGGFYLNRNASPTATFGTTTAGLKSKNTLDLSARAGFVVDQALIYGLTGYTSTNYETTGLIANESKRLGGLRYGGGIEYALTPQMSIRGEYTHANYKDWNVANGTDTINFNPSEHRFMVGASLRF